MLARSALEVDFETLFLTVSAEERTENCDLVKVSFAPVEVELVALSKCSPSALKVRLEVALEVALEMAVWEAGWLAAWLTVWR